MRKITILGLMVSVISLSACSQSDNRRMVNIVSGGPTASCIVMNENSQAVLSMTPGGVLMSKAELPTQVACSAPGGWHGSATGPAVSYVEQDVTIVVPMSRN